MPQLVNGVWQEQSFEPPREEGRFARTESAFRNWITADGSSGFPAEAGRYHLYVSLACPWAHRTLIFRKLKGLEDVIGVSVVDPHMSDHGWYFSDGPGCIPDTVNGFHHVHQLYTLARPDYTGEVLVPVLWDKTRRTIVNNESSEIIRMLNSEFDAFGNGELDFYPEAVRADIHQVNDFVYEDINNGVYRAGFAETQEAYEEAFDQLFAALHSLNHRLQSQRYLVGERLTEADWRLFTTLVRFDAVYYTHFKCNLKRLVDYPHLWAYTRELYQVPGVAETVNMDHIKRHYHTSHPFLNPSGIVPKGPDIDFTMPHDRAALGGRRSNPPVSEHAVTIVIERLDHLVLTVADVEATCAFYSRTLGMKPVTFGAGRRALAFGSQKINLHSAGREFDPKARRPTPGSADLCLLTSTPLEQVTTHLQDLGIEIVEGPVLRTGALGPIRSVYFRDPDGNLIELANDSATQ